MGKRESILEWYRRQHKFMDAPCGGRGDCGRCKIKFLSNAPEASERELLKLSEEEIKQGIRLACMTEKNGQIEKTDFIWIDEIFWGNKERTYVDEQEEFATPSEKISEVYPKQERAFGIALDIGTTTLVIRLVELREDGNFFTWTSMNHQRIYGADVISRIQAANEGKLKELQGCIKRDIYALLGNALIETGILAKQIKKIVVAGNTTMCHLLLGYSCEGLGKAPFEPVNISLTKMSFYELFKDIGWNTEEKINLTDIKAEVTILPGISAFIGADIVAGMYCCDMDLKEETYMLLDIGTNGEMVIGNKNGFKAASTAAGPVFEGGNISCGMPAVTGAISHIKDGQYEVLGKIKPKGICGSAIIDLAAYLFQKCIIDENGTLSEEYFDDGYLLSECVNAELTNIKLTQQDIRELQMGKGAIRAGIEVLLQYAIPDQIYLAGGFGTAIDVKSACCIGLLPKEVEKKVISVGNTVIEGLHKYLMDPDGEARVINITKNVQEILLAETGKFEESYIHFMQFLV